MSVEVLVVFSNLHSCSEEGKKIHPMEGYFGHVLQCEKNDKLKALCGVKASRRGGSPIFPEIATLKPFF